MRRGFTAWAIAKAKFSAPDSKVALSPKLVAIIDASFGVTSWAELQHHLADPHVRAGNALLLGLRFSSMFFSSPMQLGGMEGARGRGVESMSPTPWGWAQWGPTVMRVHVELVRG